VNCDFDSIFPRYTLFDPVVPVWCVTPNLDGAIHRFYNSSPISPSGRYLALTRLPFENRRPEPGEIAEVVLVDLCTGKSETVAHTKGWDTQLGAQVQWGATDLQLFFNDVDVARWVPFGVRLNPLTGEKQAFDGTVYAISPDGKWAASTCLRRASVTQRGYGVVVPDDAIPANHGAADNDGVFLTDTNTGEVTLAASYKKIVDEAVPPIDMSRYGLGDYYGFHVSWNAKGDRILLVLRYVTRKDGKFKPQLITMKPDGSDIRVAVPASEWADKGGNHPHWCPDGEHLMMNLNIGEGKRFGFWRRPRHKWRFVKCRFDGANLGPITSVPANGGHPTLHSSGRFILTDAYPKEKAAFGDDTAPLWLIDLEKGEKVTLVRIDAVSKYFKKDNGRSAGPLRVDLHPAWDGKTHTRVVFNGVSNGTRHVFVADLSRFVGQVSNDGSRTVDDSQSWHAVDFSNGSRFRDC
jgi:hypothetical protein